MSKRLIWSVLACAAVLLVPAPPAASAEATIQPGDFMSSSVGDCTLGFVFDAPGRRVYLSTAAHCVSRVGADVKLEDGRVFGDAAAIGNADVTGDDWALIAVRAAFVSMVKPGVRGYPKYPTGYTTPPRTARGDLVQFSGYGVPWYLHPSLRQDRQGLMGADTTTTYDLVGSDTWGDSGGPIVHVASGKALGIVSRLCAGACTSEGPTVQGILAHAAAKGLRIKLRTV